MNAADKDLLVALQMALPNGQFVRSTGYPVQRDLILTARHGLFHEDCQPEQCTVKLRWFHQKDELGKPIDVPRSDIIWNNQDLDVALIRCAFPEGLNGWRRLSRVRPKDGAAWTSEGFPLGANTENGMPDAFPIRGTLHDAATTANRFDLELPENFASPEDWGGVSGAPVFVDGQIVGIIVSTPKKAGGRLNAVFSADLFKDQEFDRHVGYSREDEKRVAALQALATACLSDSEKARDYLGQALGISTNDANTLAAKLVRLTTPEAVIDTIEDAHDLACANKEPSAAAKLRELILIALPACYYAHVVESIQGDIANPNCPVLKPPRICNPIAAEIAMAAVNGDSAEFRAEILKKEAASKVTFVGVNKLDPPPNCGIKAQVEDSRFKSDWDQHLINKFAPEINPHRFKEDIRLKIAADRLQPTKRKKRNHYVLIEQEDTDNPIDLTTWERRAKLVRDDCPALVFLLLSNDNEWVVTETALLDPFCNLLAQYKETNP